MRFRLFIPCFLLIASHALAQSDRWQQRVKYQIEVDFDATKHQYTGTEKLVYSNNSPDTLQKVFYHLYLNAFQPGSQMDVRSRTISDPDPRVKDRIAKLSPSEIGFEKIRSLKHNGKPVKYEVVGTILEVTLSEKILPKTQHTFEMEFEAQVPVQIRRTGRDNKEDIDYSMAQWYPKMCEYDYEGWHANPYIAREFYGIWGDFDVKIKLDAAYVVAATGYLQDPDKIGHGYSKKDVKHKPGEKLTWHFIAPEVHDFMWAADRDYAHDIVKVDNGLDLHFFYQTDTLASVWKEMEPLAVRSFKIMNEKFGRYPYKQYSIIQGGDGGMEYPMATLITGRQGLSGLVSVAVHESIHSWFQGLLGTNESKYAWMDEGFTTYAQNLVMAELFPSKRDPQAGSTNSYRALVKSGLEEPMTTHSDHYNTNRAYSIAAYSKGAVFLNQLGYIIGSSKLESGMKRYFREWEYKHPNPTDLKRIMEKESGLELDWYWEDFVGTTKTIDYSIREVTANAGKTDVVLERIGQMPMPLDVVVSYKDGSQENFYIPLEMMRGEKEEKLYSKTTLLADWGWTYPEYSFTIDRNQADIVRIVIDPSQRMADIEPENNTYPATANRETPRARGEKVIR
ncbi:M1 family metallopeptidase [Dyadobacter sandarakinus]|uniref:M1 family metallopeptidase n=1 Tax=Dyadobacter sandarakinus TaxID=2747268 RepID=A0ABX7ICW5_9BACT|nr:M1 family metallopeptidase [Dyadobacter sandarakinus]QRR03779.1 M1 family metallopeptidase [Dyadobacter sandarakinus]